MPIDPRRQSGATAEVRAAQRVADLERRIGQLELGTKGAVIASGIVQQASGTSYTFPFPVATTMAWSALTLTAQVPTIAVLTFTGTIDLTSAQNTDGFGLTSLYKDGVAEVGDATLSMDFTTGVTVSLLATASVAHAWRVTLPAGQTALELRGVGALSHLTMGSLSYLQTRV